MDVVDAMASASLVGLVALLIAATVRTLFSLSRPDYPPMIFAVGAFVAACGLVELYQLDQPYSSLIKFVALVGTLYAFPSFRQYLRRG